MAAPGTKAPRSGCRYWLLPLPMDDKWYFSKVDFSRFAEEKCFVSASHLIGNSRGLWNIAHHHSQNSSPQDAHVRDVLPSREMNEGWNCTTMETNWKHWRNIFLITNIPCSTNIPFHQVNARRTPMRGFLECRVIRGWLKSSICYD